MFRFNSIVDLCEQFLSWAESLLAQPSGWVSGSSELAHGSQQARSNAAFFLRFHAPWID